MVMLDMDGAAFLEIRRACPRPARTSVIVMFASFKLGHAGERSAAAAPLSKPFRIDELLTHVEAVTAGAHRGTRAPGS